VLGAAGSHEPTTKKLSSPPSHRGASWLAGKNAGLQLVRFAATGAVLTFVGLIHAPKVELNANGQVTLGYLFLATVCVLFALTKPAPRAPDEDELKLLSEEVSGNTFTEAPAGGVPVPASS